MANDRLIIVCRECKAIEWVFKFYPVQSAIGGSFSADPGRIARFMEHHMDNCHPHRTCMDLGGDPLFFFVTENYSIIRKEGDDFRYGGELDKALTKTECPKSGAAES